MTWKRGTPDVIGAVACLSNNLNRCNEARSSAQWTKTFNKYQDAIAATSNRLGILHPAGELLPEATMPGAAEVLLLLLQRTVIDFVTCLDGEGWIKLSSQQGSCRHVRPWWLKDEHLVRATILSLSLT